MTRPKLHFAGTPSEIIERLMKAFDEESDVQAALAGMLDPDVITPERLQSKMFSELRGSTFFSILIALNALIHGTDKVKSFIEMAIRSDRIDEDQTKGENLSNIVPAIMRLSKLKVEEYEELKTWIYTKVFGFMPKHGTLRVVPLNTFSFRRGLQFESSSSTLRNNLPTLRRALRKVAPKAKVVNEPTHVFIDAHEEIFPLTEETNE